MASTNVNNAALFGDSDSSDESVKDEVMQEANLAEEGTTKEGANAAEESKPSEPAETKPSNANLFGDDSSDDDEFDGDDGIIGKSVDSNKAPVDTIKKPQTYNEKLGLEDSDEENEATKKLDGSQPESLKPVNVPPRQMELLDLHPSDTSSQSLHIVKLPNLVGINTTPYSRANHNLEEEEEYYRGYVHNMIRWRYQTEGDKLKRDEDGNPIRESNTRLVKWSDGSYTLQVGQEVLEMDTLDSSVPVNASGEDKGGSLPGFAGINGYLYVSQKARIRPQKQTDEEIKDDENKEEEKAQPAGTVLECVGPIASRFAPRPSSLASEAHRNLTNAIRQRNVKRARIAEIVTDFDPEKEKLARIKGKDDLEKSRNRKGRRSEGGRRKMNESYLEDDERYEGVNLRKLKTQTMRGRGDYSDDEEMDYGEDSESEEDEWSKNKKRQKGVASAMREKIENKKIGDVENSDSSEEGEIVFGDDDDDEEEGTMFKKKGAAKKSNILDDDDD